MPADSLCNLFVVIPAGLQLVCLQTGSTRICYGGKRVCRVTIYKLGRQESQAVFPIRNLDAAELSFCTKCRKNPPAWAQECANAIKGTHHRTSVCAGSP